MSEIIEVDIDKFRVSKINVRKHPGDISDLAKSIEQIGVIEPLLVRPDGKMFDVVAGTRRLAAAKKIGLKKLPCVIRVMDDETAMIVSITDNIQRGDLGEEEIVEAFLILKELNAEKWTQAEFAKQLGKSPSWVSNSLAAYEALQKIRASGLDVSMKSNPRKEERDKGALPVKHLQEVEFALRSSEVQHEYPVERERDDKRIELVDAIRDMPQEDAKRVVDKFRMYPEKSISELKSQVEARKSGVQIGKTYLHPKIARQLDELAESEHSTMEEVLPGVVERGLSFEQVKLVEVDETEDALTQISHKPDIPLGIQLHEQRLWNLTQISELDPSRYTDKILFDVITVGFSQKTVENLIESLKIASVEMLVDVRNNPFSRYKPEFNKSRLTSALKDEGIQYLHIGQLGIPRSLRDRAYSGEITRDELFELYDREILEEALLDTLDDLIKKHTAIALLCTEISPNQCHRHRIALALKKRGRTCYDI